MSYVIVDWAYNRIKPLRVFETFQDAWDYILGDMTDELKLTEENYQEYLVIESNELTDRELKDEKLAGQNWNI